MRRLGRLLVRSAGLLAAVLLIPGCATTDADVTESEGSEGPLFGVVIHADPAVGPELLRRWENLARFMADLEAVNADRVDPHRVSIMFTPNWVDLLTDDTDRATLVGAWIDAGHTIAFHSHSHNHAFRDGYSNATAEFGPDEVALCARDGCSLDEGVAALVAVVAEIRPDYDVRFGAVGPRGNGGPGDPWGPNDNSCAPEEGADGPLPDDYGCLTREWTNVVSRELEFATDDYGVTPLDVDDPSGVRGRSSCPDFGTGPVYTLPHAAYETESSATKVSRSAVEAALMQAGPDEVVAVVFHPFSYEDGPNARFEGDARRQILSLFDVAESVSRSRGVPIRSMSLDELRAEDVARSGSPCHESQGSASAEDAAGSGGPSPGSAELVLAIGVHVEGWSDEDTNEDRFRIHRDGLLGLAEDAQREGVVLTFEVSPVFVRAVAAWDDDVLERFAAAGHGVAVHADAGGRAVPSLASLTTELRSQREALAAVGFEATHVSGTCSRGPWVEAALAAGFTSTSGGVLYCAASMDPDLLDDATAALVAACTGPADCHGSAPVSDERRLHPFHATSSTDWMVADVDEGLVVIVSETAHSFACLDEPDEGACRADPGDISVFEADLADYAASVVPDRTTVLAYSWSIGSLPPDGYAGLIAEAAGPSIADGRARWATLDTLDVD